MLDVSLEEVTRSFASEERQANYYARIVARWPNVTEEEYNLILPTIWVNDWFDQKSLCRMPYRDFLRTAYWKAISWRAKKENPRCHDCAEYLQQLHVHHKTYERRGLEWLFPDDLVVLCHKCHRVRHNLWAE